MVEVKGEVIGGSVLLAGDTIEVCITYTAPSLEPSTSVESSETSEVIAWGSAQVHCICMINDVFVKLPSGMIKSSEDNVTNSATSFAPWSDERGHLVLATKPKILFCDLHLMAGQSRSFIYRENLPIDAPPSYRGRLVKYAYKVTIGTQRLGSPINLLRLPLRVIVLQGIMPTIVNSETEDLAPSNPFLHTSQREQSRQNTGIQCLQSLSTMKNMSQYNIVHSLGHVVTFTVYKNTFRLGEDITATFDFSKAEIPCVQFSATLQSEEEVTRECSKKEKQSPIVVSYNKTHEVCLSYTHTNFLLPIPLHITPTFSTDIVKLRWLLHFEFVLNIGGEANILPGRPDSILNRESEQTFEIWSAPSKMKIETLVWDLPINICPTSPNQLSQALAVPSTHSQKL